MANPSITLEGKKYPMTQVTKTLLKIGKMWRKNARISLRMQDKVNTGTLYNSIPVQVGTDNNGFFVNLTPKAHYWEFVDKGVQGAKKNIFTGQSKSPFKFGSGKGPRGLRGAIDKWVVQKNLRGSRDAQGRFVPRKSMTFLISKAIYTRGLKPTFFMANTKKKIKNKALKWLSQAIGKDYANALRLNLKLDQKLEVK
tara:strand:- start:1385 stop:1975 length:591 start_codon:yes stop_codon:yes gene_type:complete